MTGEAGAGDYATPYQMSGGLCLWVGHGDGEHCVFAISFAGEQPPGDRAASMRHPAAACGGGGRAGPLARTNANAVLIRPETYK